MFCSETVFIALCGHSPAVITETIWALASASEAVVPDRVVVFTTTSGRKRICEDVFDSGRWEAFRRALKVDEKKLRWGCDPSSIRVFPNPDGGELDDIGSPRHSNAIADYLLEQLRGFTESPDCKIIFSVAGGRKTMSALGAMCMMLLGRKDDRLCHILVNPPFDSPAMQPKFLFPDPEIAEYRLDGQLVSAADASIQLVDIPFVPVRYLFEDFLKQAPGGYMNMVRTLRGHLVPGEQWPELHLDFIQRSCNLGEKDVHLSSMEFLLLALLARQAKEKVPLYRGVHALYNAFREYLEQIDFDKYPNLDDARCALPVDPKEIRKPYSRLKKRLCDAAPGISIFAGKQRHYGIILPPEKINFTLRDV